MPVRDFLPLALLGAALTIAAPAAAQSLPPQPPEGYEQVSPEWDQARANWVTECTWNQARGNRSRAEAREYCEAYLANRTRYAAGYQPVAMAGPAIIDGGGSSYAEPNGEVRRPVAAKRRAVRPGQERMQIVWRKRCEAMLGQGYDSDQSGPN